MAVDDDYSSHRSRRDDREASHRPQRGSHRDKQRSRRQSRSPSPHPDPQPLHTILARHGVAKLTPDDYFIRSAEFKAWLSETKSKYLDEISSKDARRYFDRFIRCWNEGKLNDDYYKGKIRGASSAAGSSTRHRWGFTAASAAEREQLAMIRDTVDTLTNGDSRGAQEARDAERKSRRSHAQTDPDPPPTARDSNWTPPNSKSHAQTQYHREHAE
ncbi:uncharacterized protein SPSC_04900 [Sporisorium scitamineum]|uniref:Uncharacterized protein n=1 Tax=Sporisorium scitamineum TaxID=49012 RepID=A0A0F7RWJ2_9BASI|nr:hypothetical protein [Sporisorium scitamineum]CDU25066.1 uncharacterized protein SPSC_04900 [Sporisorium scitamineum]